MLKVDFMKLRIISDIHCDINSEQNTSFDFAPDDFVICCGDISGDRLTTEKWIQDNIKQGIVVGGNHLGYTHLTYDKDESLNLSIKYLQNKFSGPVHFLENQSIVIDNMCFMGSILFTDFNLYGNPDGCRFIAQKYLNDFRNVKLYEKGKLRTISTEDQLMFHKKSLNFIEKTCQKYKDKKVVIITHHAPSLKSISEEYKKDLLSAAFASNLEYLFERYSNIKLWCHGHIHSSVDYKLKNARIVANPLGYGNENKNFNNEGVLIDTDNL